MKIYITQEPNQYSIYKVADQFIHQFEKEKSGSIVVKSETIAEALTKFENLDKEPGIDFNTELTKYRNNKHQLKL